MNAYGDLVWLGRMCWEVSAWAARASKWVWSARFAAYAAFAWCLAFHLLVQR
jgi:hypothetical protein